MEKTMVGWRKLALTVGLVAFVLGVSAKALFAGVIDGNQWNSLVMFLVPAALGIFTTGNVLEHKLRGLAK